MQSEAEWWWCRSQTTVLLFVYSIALASFTSDERIHASKIIKVVFIRSVYPAEQKRLSIRNFRPPHSIYSAVFQIGKKKILLHFVWGTGGVTLTIGLAYKNLHPRCTPLTGIKVASIVSSNSEGVFPKCQTHPLISPVLCFQSFSTATLDARPTPFPSSWLFYRGSAGRLVVFTAFWDRLPSLSSF